jgi:hypothetical protein
MNREQRAESREQRAESREQRAVEDLAAVRYCLGMMLVIIEQSADLTAACLPLLIANC